MVRLFWSGEIPLVWFVIDLLSVHILYNVHWLCYFSEVHNMCIKSESAILGVGSYRSFTF